MAKSATCRTIPPSRTPSAPSSGTLVSIRHVTGRRDTKALLESRAECRRAFVTDGSRHLAYALALGEQTERRHQAALPPPHGETQSGLLNEQPLERAQTGAADLSCDDLERATVVGPRGQIVSQLARPLA